MSLTGDNTAKFWANCPKILGHRRRSSSSGLFNINLGEPILAKYRFNNLAKLHSDSSALGLNAINKGPTLPRGTLFRSSLPATPLTSPMYTSVLHQFTERAIQDLLGKSSTPKVVKSSSDFELKIDNQTQQPQQSNSKVLKTNLFDVPTDQNIITRGTLNIRPKTLDIKSKTKLDTNLAKINENGKSDEIEKTLYYSIKEEQEEVEDCTPVENKPVNKLDKSDLKDKTINECKESKVTTTELNVSNDKVVKSDKLNDKTNSTDKPAIKLNAKQTTNSTVTQQATKSTNDSTIETIILDDSSDLEGTVQKLENLSIDKSKLNNGEKIEQNGVHRDSTDNDNEQQNCLFVRNLHYNINNDEIQNYFIKLGLDGCITKIVIPKEPNSKNAKGFGFVTFSNLNDVQKIINMPKNSLKLRGRTLLVDLAKNKSK